MKILLVMLTAAFAAAQPASQVYCKASLLNSRNMKGLSAGSEAFKRLKLMQPFTYQCSHQSTASEIKDVFEVETTSFVPS